MSKESVGYPIEKEEPWWYLEYVGVFAQLPHFVGSLHTRGLMYNTFSGEKIV